MHSYFAAYLAILFFLLTPGVLLRFPAHSTKLVVAVTHGLFFIVALYFTKHVVLRLMHDGFQDLPSNPQGTVDVVKLNSQIEDSIKNAGLDRYANSNGLQSGESCTSENECKLGLCINGRCL